MLAKVAGSNQFKVGTGDKSWSELEYQPNVSGNNGLIYKDGELIVDFAQMPTEKFEVLLKSLKIKIWLTEDTNFYVDGTNGSDVLSENRGLLEENPFKTIQACINYVCGTYNLQHYNVIIYIADGTYNEQIILGKYESSTGMMTLAAKNFRKVYIETTNTAYTILLNNPSTWRIFWLQIASVIDNSVPSTNSFYNWIVNVSNKGTLYIYSCEISFLLLQDNVYTISAGISVADATCYIDSEGFITIHNKTTNIESSASKYIFYGFRIYFGICIIYGCPDSGRNFISVKGWYTDFIRLSDRALLSIVLGTGTSRRISYAGETSGRRFFLTADSTLNSCNYGLKFFPGNAEGYIDSTSVYI